MVANVLEVNPERLWESLERSAEIGRFRDVGLRRLALSAEDKQMRDLFVEWAKTAGCTVEIDRLGNIFARRPGTDPSLPPVAIGSHLDTQICGGRYDGILGVLCGLEVVRTLNDRGLQTRRGIEVICWTNEEGARFNPPMMGSMAFAGVLPLESVLATTDDAGITVEQALDEIGYAGPAPVGRTFDAYLELHIEQAPVLDREGCDVGIVVGGYKTQALRLTINGDTGHAGGTPMAQRRNALVGAGYVIAAVNDIGLAFAADEGRTTTTRIESFPNLAGTYAEQVKLTIDFRHIDADRFKAMRAEVDAAIAAAAKKANVEIEVAEGWSWGSELFAPECIELLKSTAKELGLPYREMRSQAGHDAYAVATMAPTAMIFTPCFEGISHNVNEAIELTRSVPGANLLLNAAVTRANR
ncbi:Zn-dependent hydrolase [Reyranella sp. MMS21-HV4-11]|jgi:N-carbamoyl-L-amino-acid hydrolase|uniref:Zn-dependent hydrolase n=1 Tax=Reyranella humidisoli TaxID=2849149 RepID=A0ABS6IGY1_9HYPH|nr:Zn-dependent hydrolase [Reyranella sp. MMS21-HV4-11]MBU8872505.1 Zn-dependent hydrolase [Reyranella sp. MMS21-HV4-11]